MEGYELSVLPIRALNLHGIQNPNWICGENWFYAFLGGPGLLLH